MRREQQEVERLLKRKKELILREEEEEVHHPKKELNALDRLSQNSGYRLSFPDPVRAPRFATKDWEEPGTVEEHQKIILAWCLGSLLFASLLGLITVTWQCWSKKEENRPSPLELARAVLALIRRRKRREASTSAEMDAQNSVELEPLK